MESANMILYWDRSIVTDKTGDFNKHGIVFIDRDNKTAIVTDTAIHWTFPTLRQKKLQNMKTWSWK
jgi:hypothetical protein